MAQDQAQGSAPNRADPRLKRSEGRRGVDYLCSAKKHMDQWQVADINLGRDKVWPKSVTGQIQAVLRQGSYQSLIAQMKARVR